MTPQSGQMLSHYRLVEKIGEGGMGVVWKAKDTRLGRHVAIKVLPESLSADPERLARFGREARVLASFHHSSIAGIHAFEHDAQMHFLVMEMVEGEDLHEQISRGPIPADEARAIAVQIATALEAAHEKGIIHRDLKPANIKIGPDGQVKVLDFGLAKALAPASSGAEPDADLATTLTPLTRPGTTMGTPAYMSPEQVNGKPADRLADIWSFGCVLHEMLTGRRLFRGDSVSETLAAVLRDDVDLDSLPPGTPRELRRLLDRCLDREPRTRLQSIGEARIALEASPPKGDAAELGLVDSGHRRRPHWPMFLLAAALVLAGIAIGAIILWGSSESTSTVARTPRVFMEQISGRSVGEAPRDAPAKQAISPDGNWIAYTAGGRLWLRNVNELQAREVPDSAGARGVFWSPRSDAVAYSAGDRLLKFPIRAARPTQLCRFSGGDFSGGSWSASQGIILTLSRANWYGDVLRVSEEGGVPEAFTTPNSERGERRLLQPHFLPDGRSLFYTVVTKAANNGEIAIERAGVRTLLGLGNGTSQPAWSPTGHLVYTRSRGPESALWALPFSLESLSALGEPFLIAEGGAGGSIASDGTLAYEVRRPEPEQLVWVDRAGRLLGTIGEPLALNLWAPAISPDGHRVVASVNWAYISVWDLDRSVHTRITSETEVPLLPEWSPTGEEIAYTLLGDEEALMVRRADGSGDARVILRQKGAAAPSYSRDGAFVAYYVVDPETNRDLWAVAVNKSDEPFVLLRTNANEALPRISPDGTLVAYQSDASGRWEVYVQPFPEGEGRWQISSGGGQHPRWNPQGGELFFVSGKDLMATTVTTQPEVRFGPPQRLFSEDAIGTKLSLPRHVEHFYDVSLDGESFVVVKGIQRGSSDLVLAEGVFGKRQ